MPQYPIYTWGGSYPLTTTTLPWAQNSPYANPVSQTQMKMPGIYGHFVNSESEITPNEVPMDGSYAIFPTNDFSRVFIKSWNMDGTISTREFSPVVNSDKVDDMKTSELSLAQFDTILEKLSHIEQQLS